MRKKISRKRCVYCVLLVLICMLCLKSKAEAAPGETGQEMTVAQERTAVREKGTGQEEAESLGDSFLEELDFSGLDEVLDRQDTTKDFDFRGLVEKLISGEKIDKKWLLEEVKVIIFQELNQSRGYLIQIVLLVVAFALLYNFSNVFENAAVTDISFYIVYMILLALLMKSFLIMSGILNETLKGMLDFMRALMPAFCLSIMFSTGTATSMGFYQLTLFLIYLIENVLLYMVVPAVHIYILLELLNHLTGEELISKMTELMESGVKWVLKIMFTIVIGINVVQGMLNPVIDGFKTSAFARTAGMLPGIGGSIQGVTEIMVGSGIIIKNGVGMAGILVLLLMCAGPMIKVGILTLLYKLTGAVVQPIADKRLAGCINGMGKGAGLFGKVLVTAGTMLMVTIALVSAATTWNR